MPLTTNFGEAMKSLRPSENLTVLQEQGLASMQSPPQFITFEEVAVAFATVLILAIASLFLYWALKQFYRAFRIAANRPISADAVATSNGAVELEATAQPLDESDDGERIAYKRERQKKERERDSDGNTEEKWKTVSTSERASPFRLTDDTGSVVVDPDGSNLSLDMELSKSSSRRRTYTGKILPGDTVHVYGQRRAATDAEDLPDDVEVYIGDGDVEFLISDTTQFRTIIRYLMSGSKYLLFALIPLGFGILLTVVTLDMVFGFNPLGV